MLRLIDKGGLSPRSTFGFEPSKVVGGAKPGTACTVMGWLFLVGLMEFAPSVGSI